jgi:hypothetical protein
MAAEEAAAREPGGPSGPDDRINVSLLILQRVDRVEQRVDHLEQRLERFEDKVDARFTALDAKFDAKIDDLRKDIDARFGVVDGKFDGLRKDIDARFSAVDGKFDGLRRELAGMNSRMVGLLVLLLVAVLAKLFLPHL